MVLRCPPPDASVQDSSWNDAGTLPQSSASDRSSNQMSRRVAVGARRQLLLRGWLLLRRLSCFCHMEHAAGMRKCGVELVQASLAALLIAYPGVDTMCEDFRFFWQSISLNVRSGRSKRTAVLKVSWTSGCLTLTHPASLIGPRCPSSCHTTLTLFAGVGSPCPKEFR